MFRLKKQFLFVIAVLLIGIKANAGSINKDSIITILFVGNSLTYTNDLPALVEKETKKKNIQVKTEMVAHPNYALEDHWNDGVFKNKLAEKKYDYVVVQQGPSSQAEGKAMLLDYGARIKEQCDKYNAILVFFMVWPAYDNYANFDGVIKNYTDAASATGSILCPVGKVWKQYFTDTNDYSYYGPDRFHPSPKGSETAARVITDTLFR
jgi:lysophospholipase L1-like esterase